MAIIVLCCTTMRQDDRWRRVLACLSARAMHTAHCAQTAAVDHVCPLGAHSFKELPHTLNQFNSTCNTLTGLVISELPGTTSLSDEEIRSDVTATGPTASSLLLPNTEYTSTGKNAPYRPYTLGTPAMLALQVGSMHHTQQHVTVWIWGIGSWQDGTAHRWSVRSAAVRFTTTADNTARQHVCWQGT